MFGKVLNIILTFYSSFFFPHEESSSVITYKMFMVNVPCPKGSMNFTLLQNSPLVKYDSSLYLDFFHYIKTNESDGSVREEKNFLFDLYFKQFISYPTSLKKVLSNKSLFSFESYINYKLLNVSEDIEFLQLTNFVYNYFPSDMEIFIKAVFIQKKEKLNIILETLLKYYENKSNKINNKIMSQLVHFLPNNDSESHLKVVKFYLEEKSEYFNDFLFISSNPIMLNTVLFKLLKTTKNEKLSIKYLDFFSNYSSESILSDVLNEILCHGINVDDVLPFQIFYTLNGFFLTFNVVSTFIGSQVFPFLFFVMFLVGFCHSMLCSFLFVKKILVGILGYFIRTCWIICNSFQMIFMEQCAFSSDVSKNIKENNNSWNNKSIEIKEPSTSPVNFPKVN